jgi:hypothetical protein
LFAQAFGVVLNQSADDLGERQFQPLGERGVRERYTPVAIHQVEWPRGVGEQDGKRIGH